MKKVVFTSGSVLSCNSTMNMNNTLYSQTSGLKGIKVMICGNCIVEWI